MVNNGGQGIIPVIQITNYHGVSWLDRADGWRVGRIGID